jgi:probable F420-dependent oxidoreductase
MTAPAIALFGINIGPMADPSVMLRVAREAEAAGYESVWTGEHIVLPDPQAPPSPLAPGVPVVDTAVALSYLAAATSTIRLGTGIIILPQRQPVVLAKSLASLDHVSGGRLIFGFGVGYLEPELVACGAMLADRAERADEYLRAMRQLWSGDAVSFDGRLVSFDRVTAYPKPVQSPLPVVVGGHSQRAAERAVSAANGWFGFRRDVETAKADIARLVAAEAECGRPAELGRLEISITPPRRLQPGDAEAYAEIGVDRLILQPGDHRSVDEILAYIEQHRPSP